MIQNTVYDSAAANHKGIPQGFWLKQNVKYFTYLCTTFLEL